MPSLQCGGQYNGFCITEINAIAKWITRLLFMLEDSYFDVIILGGIWGKASFWN